MAKRHIILAAFVNVVDGAILHREGQDPKVLERGEHVTPPGMFESKSEAQIERLTRALCLQATGGTGKADKSPTGASGEGVSHGDKTGADGTQETGDGANAGTAAGEASGDGEDGSGQVAGNDGGGPGDGPELDAGGRGGGKGGKGGKA